MTDDVLQKNSETLPLNAHLTNQCRRVGLKIDVDTEEGTRVGVPQLASFLNERGIKATFYFSLGKDNTGRSLFRLLQPGFLKKVLRTRVPCVYGLKTLLNGLLWVGPHIGKRHAQLMRHVKEMGHEVGIHGFDHTQWQNSVIAMRETDVRAILTQAHKEFFRIFGESAKTMAAPGWIATRHSLKAYDDSGLLYASDTRGERAFFPKCVGQLSKLQFKTLQIPTTLPTLDEILGDKNLEVIHDFYIEKMLSHSPLCINTQDHVLTVHAELEGMYFFTWFKKLIIDAQKRDVSFVPLKKIAHTLLNDRQTIPSFFISHISIPGRGGVVTVADETAR